MEARLLARIGTAPSLDDYRRAYALLRRILARGRRDPPTAPRRPVIGGKVLDASALAELARRRPAAFAWLRTARELNIALYVPALALAEVRAVRPDAAPLLADLLTHPSVLVGELDAAIAEEVERYWTQAHSTLWPDMSSTSPTVEDGPS